METKTTENLAILLLCLISLHRPTMAAAHSDDLDDFEFFVFNADLEEEPQQYSEHDSQGVAKSVMKAAVNAAVVDGGENLQDTNLIPLDEDWTLENEYDANYAPGQAFNYREKLLRKALAKALTNVSLRQRFVEVMPILRVLNPQQRLALSALISAQMQKQHDQPLKLEEVRQMFGDDRKLLLPIMFDIANLVSSSAYKYLPPVKPLETSYAYEQRKYELTPQEEAEENESVGIAEQVTEDVPEDDMLDPQDINDQLQATKRVRRKRRSSEGTQLFHKLIRAVPLQDDVNESPMLNLTTYEKRNFQEETTVDAKTDGQDYQEIENMALANLNGSSTDEQSTDLPVTMQPSADEALPQPEAIISGHRYRLNANKVRIARPKPVASRKRVQIHARPKVGTPGPAPAAGPPLIRKCERFTASMCIRTDDYPL